MDGQSTEGRNDRKENYLTGLRDYYIDKPFRVLRRYLIFQVAIIALHFLIGGNNYGTVFISSTFVFLFAFSAAYFIHRKWPRYSFK